MALPPLAWLNWAALTVIAGLVLAVLLPSLRSLAVRVKLPFVPKETERLVVPAPKATAKGRLAVGLLELKPSVSLTVLILLYKLSTALTVTENVVLATCALGVPVFPLIVPGAAVSPGTSNWSLLNGPVPTTTFPELALVKPVAVKLSVIVSARV